MAPGIQIPWYDVPVKRFWRIAFNVLAAVSALLLLIWIIFLSWVWAWGPTAHIKSSNLPLAIFRCAAITAPLLILPTWWLADWNKRRKKFTGFQVIQRRTSEKITPD